MNKIEHIGIAVKDIEKSNKLFASLLNQINYLLHYLVKNIIKLRMYLVKG